MKPQRAAGSNRELCEELLKMTKFRGKLKETLCGAAAVLLATVLLLTAGCRDGRPGGVPAPDGKETPVSTGSAEETAGGQWETVAPEDGEKTPAVEETSNPGETETEAPSDAPLTRDPGDATPGATDGPDTTDEPEATDAATFVPEETGQAPATDVPPDAPTAVPDETPAPETTEAPTATPTAVPAETPAPEPTVAPPEIDPLRIVFDDALKRDVLSYFANAKFTSVKQGGDAEEGGVAVLETVNVTSAGTSTPSVFFKYRAFCESAGVKSASISERPFVVLKLKGVNRANGYVSVMAAGSIYDSETMRREAFLRLEDQSGWQYLCFDFSGVANATLLSMFRISLEQFAAGNGERIEIAEILFLTAEEAEPYRKADVYEVREQSGAGLDLRILQFNIQTENGNASPFRVRADMYRELLDRLMPDVVGMQEVTVNWRKWLDAYVFNGSYAGVGEERTPGGEANPIYYRKDKFELLEYGTFWLSDTPDVPGSAFEKVNYPRICTWVLLKDRATGVSFVHFNTHLDHNGNNNSTDGNTIRKEQMKVIIRFSQRFKDLPMFLTGDLNNRRTTSEGKLYALYKMITGESKVDDGNGGKIKMPLGDSRIDAPVTVDENHLATMTANYNESSTSYNPQKEPIDYVFYNKENTVANSYETFLISRNGNWISDHLPVFTTFTINK